MYRKQLLKIYLAIGTIVLAQSAHSIPYKIVIKNYSKRTIYADVTPEPNSSKNSLAYSGPVSQNQEIEMNLLYGSAMLIGFKELEGKSAREIRRFLKKMGSLYLRIAYGLGFKVIPLFPNGSTIFVQIKDSNGGIVVTFGDGD